LRTLNNLGSSLLQRFVRTRDSRTLNEATDLLERSVATTPEWDPQLPGRLNNLGEAMSYQYVQTSDLEALDRSIALGRRAVAALSSRAPDDRQLCAFAGRLGHRLHLRYLKTRDRSAIEEAAELLRGVVAAMPVTNPDRWQFLRLAAVVLENLSSETRRPEVLEEAIVIARDGLETLPPGHATGQGLSTTLAFILTMKYRETNDRVCLQEARALYQTAVYLDASPGNQIGCCRLAANLAMEDGDWGAATDLLGRAISLLPRLASRGLTRGDQERLLKDIAGLAQDACASALQVGDPGRALTLLENGRGVLFAQMLETRSDITELWDRHPKFASRLEDLRNRLTGPSDVQSDADDHHAMARQWDCLIDEIRELPGFTRFLLPPTTEELLAATEPGPVVVLSISEHRSDAILLTVNGLDVVSLPRATPGAVEEQVRRFLAVMDPEPTVRDVGPASEWNRQVSRTLEWIWDVIAGPVLDRLALPAIPSEDGSPPRLWWCPTGPLSLLPLHAAGYHGATSCATPPTVIDRVMSSYTPTVRALLRARGQRRAGGVGDGAGEGRTVRSLVIPMPHTSGAESLPGATTEADLLRALPSGQVTVLEQPTARHAQVLAELPHHDVAHFACHAFSDPDHPSVNDGPKLTP
jgi:tetratricopeptide (TPR) repeat protein